MNGLLLDENLPLALTLPGDLPVIHATGIMSSPSDSFLWRYAKEHRLVIITKDSDFTHRILMSDPPPWIVHLRFGNLRLREFTGRITSLWPHILPLLPLHKLVTVFADRIEALE